MSPTKNMQPYRSMLFVPGHEEAWIDKAVASGADALILDLEDSVPNDRKAQARDSVSAALRRLRADGVGVGLWVRINEWELGASADIEAILCAELDGLLLPKVNGVSDVVRVCNVLDHCERVREVLVGHTKLFLALETAESMVNCEALAASSPRVTSMLGATARDGDITRALGYTSTPLGLETLYLRSRVLMACRAGGINHPLYGLWQDIHDLDGLREFAEHGRDLGYRGQVVLHPSHVDVVNDVFTPSRASIEAYREMIAEWERAASSGRGAVMFRGKHIDLAHVRTAMAAIERSELIEAMSTDTWLRQ